MNLDLTERKSCQQCGASLLVQDLIVITNRSETVWSGCGFCLRTALSLPRYLPSLIADAITEAFQARAGLGENVSPMTSHSQVDEFLRKRMDDIRWGRR